MIWAYPLCSCETNEEDRVQVSQYFEKEPDMENIKLAKNISFLRKQRGITQDAVHYISQFQVTKHEKCMIITILIKTRVIQIICC